ncbi:Na+-driven multidrug efflux pump [Enterobacter cloacae]|uniref:Na+-driven multidrug efflux pump n=1 Tax=Enterobacter cloacae TaxID=550 RepID=A0A377LX96_ENTCL|nr:Na+-driven multidrug efflux pump [Enterobacter cloacae]
MQNVKVIVFCSGVKSPPLAVPIFLENTCVLLMGVLSTFLVSWLGKEAMAGSGWRTVLTWW